MIKLNYWLDLIPLRSSYKLGFTVEIRWWWWWLVLNQFLEKNSIRTLNIPTFGISCTIKGNESLVEIFNFYFLTPLSQNFKMLCILMSTPLQLDIWLQSYEGFDTKKQTWNKGIWTLFMPISKTTSRHPTHSSWSCHIFELWIGVSDDWILWSLHYNSDDGCQLVSIGGKMFG